MEKFIFEQPLSDLPEKKAYFKRLCGVDMDDVPEKYEDSVSEAGRLLRESCLIKGIYGRFAIESISDECVVLENGIRFSGEMPPKVLADSRELFAFVITLYGFDKLNCGDDMLVEYFADCLGSACIEAAQSAFAARLSTLLKREGLHRTHLWCPGQHGFELTNQTTVFELLAPSGIGCTLTDSLLMLPVKSSSGIFGVLPSEKENTLRPCDFCRFKPTCPGSDKGCAVI